MLIENLKLLKYSKEKGKLILQVVGELSEIKDNLSGKSELSVYTDNSDTRRLVETFFNYSTIISIREDMLSSSYEVTIVADDEIEAALLKQSEKVTSLEGENANLLFENSILTINLEDMSNRINLLEESMMSVLEKLKTLEVE